MSIATQAEPIQLTPEQLRCYREEGWAYVPNLIPVSQIEPVRKEMLAIEAGESEWPAEHCHYVDPEKVRTLKGTKYAAGLQLPSKRSQIFRDVTEHPRLVSAMSQFLGGPVQWFTDQCALKTRLVTTEQGGRSYFHQDSYYWKIPPLQGCNCWIPTNDVGRDAIALAVMPGTHLSGQLEPHEQYFDDPGYMGGRATQIFPRLRIPASKIDFSKEKLIPMRAGDGLFFGNYTWHRSEPNRTGESLGFYAIAYRLK